MPIENFVSAISVGIVDDECLLDICYEEDSQAQVDMNIIMTDRCEFVSSRLEKKDLSRKDLNKLLN